jgi:hypothetical protein
MLAYVLAMAAAFTLVWGFAHRQTWWAHAAIALGGSVILAKLFWFDCSVRAVLAPIVAGLLGLLPRGHDPTAGLRDKLGRSMVWIYLGSIATLALALWVYLPITVFLTSPGELTVHLTSLLTTNLRGAMGLIYAALLLYAVCASPRLRVGLTVVAVVGLVICLVYAFILPFGYPRMSGLLFEQVKMPAATARWRLVIDVAAVLALSWLALQLLVRVSGRRMMLGLLFVNLSLSIVAVITVRRDDLRQTAGSGATSTAPIRFTRTGNNALLIFLDRYMGGYVEQFLAEDPTLATQLDGFMWVPKSLAPGYNSIAGVHAVVGGYDYTPREMNARGRPLRELANEAFSILPSNFTKKGWEVSWLRPHGLDFTMKGDCSVLSHITGLRCGEPPADIARKAAERHGISMQHLSTSNYVDLLVLLAAMRVAPYEVKATLMERGPWLPFLRHTAGVTLNEWAQLKALPELSTATASKNQLDIVFNFLPHEPYFISEDCTPLPRKAEPSAARLAEGNWPDAFAYHHELGARCALRLVRDYLVWLREQGVYDNTTIIIASDHGIIGSVKDRSSRAIAGGTEGNEYVASRSLLLYKPRGAHGPLTVSDAFLPNAEVPRLLCEEIGGCTNPFLGDKTIEAHGRDDPFYVDVVPWQFNAQKPDAFIIEKELRLTGKDPYKRENWR